MASKKGQQNTKDRSTAGWIEQIEKEQSGKADDDDTDM